MSAQDISINVTVVLSIGLNELYFLRMWTVQSYILELLDNIRNILLHFYLVYKLFMFWPIAVISNCSHVD